MTAAKLDIIPTDAPQVMRALMPPIPPTHASLLQTLFAQLNAIAAGLVDFRRAESPDEEVIPNICVFSVSSYLYIADVHLYVYT